MDKHLFFTNLAIFAILFSMLIAPLPIHADESAPVILSDQYCDNAQIYAKTYSMEFHGNTLAQSFSPGITALTSAGIAIAMGEDLKTITLQIRRITGGDALIGTASYTPDYGGMLYLSFPFNNLPLDNTKQYQMVASTASTTAVWYYATDNCYSRGMAIINGVAHSDKDFSFFDMGYVRPITTVSPSSSTPPSGRNRTAAQSPASITLSTIAKPTSLKGGYDSNKKLVNLTWTKSTTTNIDGYRIYRSQQETKDFRKVGEVNKNIIEFSDYINLIPETNYYYFVRAYKSNGESDSSPTIAIVIPKSQATVSTSPSANTTQTKTNSSARQEDNDNRLLYILLAISALLVAFLAIYELKLKEVGRTKTSD